MSSEPLGDRPLNPAVSEDTTAVKKVRENELKRAAERAQNKATASAPVKQAKHAKAASVIEKREAYRKAWIAEVNAVAQDEMERIKARVASMPITTIHCGNLHYRYGKEAMSDKLNEVFEAYGKVLNVFVGTNIGGHGQAWVTLDTPESAEKAVKELNQFPLIDKMPMKLEIADKINNHYVQTKLTPEEYNIWCTIRKQKKMARNDEAQKGEATKGLLKRPADGAPGLGRTTKAARGEGLKSSRPGANIPEEYLAPNKVLFVQNIPGDYDMETLGAVFNRFDTFKEVRMVPGPRGLAFVEYEKVDGAVAALRSLNGHHLKGSEGKPLKVTFQRQ